MLVSTAELRGAIAAHFVAHGVRPDHAAVTAEVIVEAEAQGVGSHGLSRVPQYTAQIDAGAINPSAGLEVDSTGPATAIVRANGALGPPAAMLAVATLASLLEYAGMASVIARDAAHVGPLSAYVRRIAARGHIALAVANSPPALAPPGGTTAVLGTNPIAFAAPSPGGALVVDLSLGVAARGRILSARARGEPIPEGWAIDADGRPTTDPQAALAGALLPAGGHKGGALAVMVEVLAGVLGGVLSPSVPMPWIEPDRRSAPGFFMLGLDPARFVDAGSYERLMGELAESLRAAGGRLPGERGDRAREDAERDGVEVDETTAAQLRQLGIRLPGAHEPTP